MHCCARGVCCCCCFLQQTAERAAVCGVPYNIQNFMRWSGNKRMILCQTEHERIPPHSKHTHIKNHFFYLRKLPVWTCELDPHQKVIRPTCPVCNPQSTHAPPRRDRRGQNTCLCIPHANVCWSPLSLEQCRLALSKLQKNLLRLHSRGQRSDWLLGWAVSY